MTGQRSLPTKWVDALLLRFATIWRAKWNDEIAGIHPDLLRKECAEGLAGLSGEDIKAGIEYCRAKMPWPPSIAEFRSACRDHASAEQRAYAKPPERTQPALAHGTWGDTAAVVAEHVQAVKAKVADRQATRSLVDIASGLWTREMEANFCHHAAILGRKVKPIEWPEEVMA